MQFYWRIIEELRYLGEVVIFHDPGLVRQYDWWLKKNAAGLAIWREIEYTGVDPALRKLESLACLN